MVTLALGTGFDRGQVRAGAGLGIALHPKIVTLANAGQELFFLRGRTKFQQHRGTHGRAKGRQAGRTRQGKFFVVNVALGNVPPSAAPLHWPMRHRPAFGCQNLVPTQVVLFGQVPVTLYFFAQVGRQIGGNPVAHFVAKTQFFSRIAQVHGSSFQVMPRHFGPGANHGQSAWRQSADAPVPKRS